MGSFGLRATEAATDDLPERPARKRHMDDPHDRPAQIRAHNLISGLLRDCVVEIRRITCAR